MRIVWVGAPGDALGLRVDFWVETGAPEDEQTSVFLRPGETEAKVTLPLDSEGRLRYRFEVSRFTAAGQEPVRRGEGETNLLVVQAG